MKRFVTILVIFQYKRYKQEISFKGIEPKPLRSDICNVPTEAHKLQNST